MRETKIIAVILGICVCVAASSVTAATIPAGTTLTVNTVSLISSQTAVGRSFEAKIAQDVSVKGNVVLKAGTKVFGKVSVFSCQSSQIRTTRCGTCLNYLNGRRTTVKTNDVQPQVLHKQRARRIMGIPLARQ